jgi:hypothetical protein
MCSPVAVTVSSLVLDAPLPTPIGSAAGLTGLGALFVSVLSVEVVPVLVGVAVLHEPDEPNEPDWSHELGVVSIVVLVVPPRPFDVVVDEVVVLLVVVPRDGLRPEVVVVPVVVVPCVSHEVGPDWSHELDDVVLVSVLSVELVVLGPTGGRPGPVPPPVPPASHEEEPGWSHELDEPGWSAAFVVAGVELVLVVVEVDVVPVPPPEPPEPPEPHDDTSGPTRNSLIPACFSALFSASLACW